MDGPFPVRWRWVPEARDFAMTLGEGDEAATTARTVAYAGETVRVAKQTSRAGVVAAAETQFIDAKNGNAVVGRSVGGRTPLSATRVEAGDGLGRKASETDERGLVRAYAYDAYGRTLTETETDAGDEPRLHGRPFGSAAVADDGGGGWDDGAHCLLHGGDGGGRRPH